MSPRRSRPMPPPRRRPATWAGSRPMTPRRDEAFLKALFAAPVNTPTERRRRRSTGSSRIGRSTEIAASAVDGAYQTKIVNDGVPIDHYRGGRRGRRGCTRSCRTRSSPISSPPGPQRRGLGDLHQVKRPRPPTADSIKVRHILYSPNGDPSNASKVAQDDPAGRGARSLATEAYAKLKIEPQPVRLDRRARRATRKPTSGRPARGASCPYFDKTTSVDPAFLAAIRKPGLKPGDILPPVQSRVRLARHPIMSRPE